MKAFFLHLAYSFFYNVNKLLNISFPTVASKHFMLLLIYICFVNKNSILVLEVASSGRTFLNAFYLVSMLFRGHILVKNGKGRKKVCQHGT